MASYNLGLLLVDKGQIDGAVEAFKRCLRNDPERSMLADARSMLAELRQYSESDSD